MPYESWFQILQTVKITLTVCVAILLALCINQLSDVNVDRQLLSLGSFYLPPPSDQQWPQRGNFSKPQVFLLDPFIVRPRKNQTAMQLLPKLTELSWPEPVHAPLLMDYLNVNETGKLLSKPFTPVMTKAQRNLSRRLLKMFSDLMFEHGYGDRFFINGGTLVGSFNHHDFIPWDDDVDVLADLSLRPEIQRLLETLKPDYQWYAMHVRDKLFTRLMNESESHLDLEYSRVTSSKPWPWPFLDIGYYEVGKYLTCEYLEITRCWPTSTIFPLMYRPFGTEWYPTPCNVPKYIRTMYKMRSSCVTFGFSHTFDVRSAYARVPCYKLAKQFNFVSHNPYIEAKWLSETEALAHMFIVNEERLMTNDTSPWRVLHSLSLPMPRSELPTANKYGQPEPR